MRLVVAYPNRLASPLGGNRRTAVHLFERVNDLGCWRFFEGSQFAHIGFSMPTTGNTNRGAPA